MLLLGGIFLLLMGLLMAVFPSGYYDLTESWKHDVPGEPSDRYLLCIRIGGGFFAIVGLAGIIAFFLI